jgi:hypothetical protein
MRRIPLGHREPEMGLEAENDGSVVRHGPDAERTGRHLSRGEGHAAHARRVEQVDHEPLRTRAIADAKAKTDTIDAATLAELLAADYLPTVWQPDPETRALRRRVAGRAALVAERTRLRNRISAVLIRNPVACPWSAR